METIGNKYRPFTSFISCIRTLMGAFQFINRLVGAVLLGDVGHKVEDTAGVAPLL